MSNFTIQQHDKGNSSSVIALSGSLNAHTAPDLEQVIQATIDAGNIHIVVNFGGLEYISSAGLGVFMVFIEDLREKGGDIKLCSMSEKVFNVFDLLGFPMIFDIVADENEALHKFSATT